MKSTFFIVNMYINILSVVKHPKNNSRTKTKQTKHMI